MLSMQAILQGVGVGQETATPTSAAIQWVTRDGVGMLAGIAFASMFGAALDGDAKRWRLLADILNDVGTCMEIISPYFPSSFLLIVCIATTLKSIVGVAGGATRIAFVQHQATSNNTADVSAKDGSQEKIVNIAGLLFGLLILPLLEDHVMITGLLFLLFILLHVLFNFKAVGTIVFNTLNKERLEILTHHYVKYGCMLTPELVSQRERVLVWPIQQAVASPTVNFGADVFSAVDDAQHAIHVFERVPPQNEYLVIPKIKESGRGLQLTTLYVLLGIKSSPQTEIRAWFHTSILRYFYNLLPSQTAVEDLVKVEHDAADYTEQHFSTFLTKAQAAGWDVDRSQLYPNSVRVCWKPQHRKSKQL